MQQEGNTELHIISLLYEHNFVIVPGFGGFIAKEKAASINSMGYIMTPPSKQIIFNPKLTANDGLLQQELVVKENLSYNQAEKAINLFVSRTKAELDKKHAAGIKDIGLFRKSADGLISFKQFAHANFLKNAFGLEATKILPVEKHLEKEIEKVDLTKQQTKTIVIEKLPVSYQRFKKISIAAIFVLSLSAGYLYMLSFNPRAVQEAGLNFFNVPVLDENDIERLEEEKTSQNEIRNFIEEGNDLKSQIVDTDSADILKTESEDLSEVETIDNPIIEEEVAAEEVIEEKVTQPTFASEKAGKSQTLYYVIAASLLSQEKINEEINRFKLKGFEPEIIPSDGKFRISIGSFATKDSANTYKQNIFNDNNLQTWVLTQ